MKKLSEKINSLSSFKCNDSCELISHNSAGSSVQLLQELTKIVNFLSEEKIQFFIDSDFNIHPNIFPDDSSNAFFVSLDKNGDIASINDIALKLSGYTKDELIHKSFFNIFIDDEDKEELQKVFLDILSGEHNYWKYQNNIVTKDGSKLMFQWSNILIKDDKKELSQIHAFGILLS